MTFPRKVITLQRPDCGMRTLLRPAVLRLDWRSGISAAEGYVLLRVVIGFVSLMLAAFSPLAAGRTALAADEFRNPSVSAVRVGWRAVLDQLRSEINSQAAIAPDFTFARRWRLPASDPRSMPALVQLNAVTSTIFTGIGQSPIPVLLPFDTAAYLDTRRNRAPPTLFLPRF